MKGITLLFIFLSTVQVWAFPANILTSHQLTAELGSYRNYYLYPITNLKYSSPLLTPYQLKFSARIRSYGTPYFVNRRSYDFTPLVEGFFQVPQLPLAYSLGLGLDARMRLVNDARAPDVSSSTEPLLSAALHGSFGQFVGSLPLWTRFYSNGISFSILPEISYRVFDLYGFSLRYELSYLTLYNGSTSEWRRDVFLGVYRLF